jgi:hypothetical protein
MPIASRNRSNSGKSGLAEVRVLNDQLKVIFADGDTYMAAKNGWDRPSGQYKVTLNKTHDEVKFVAPPGRNDPYLVKFQEYANRIGRSDTNPGVPEPKIKPGGWRNGPNGQYYEQDKLVFTAKLVVVSGELGGMYKGLTINYELPYIFTQYPGTLNAQLEGTAGERKKVETFLQLTGYDMMRDDIAWSGNVLPEMEAKQQAADSIFQVKLNENGFIAKDGLSSFPAYMITPELLGEEPVKAKKAAPAKSKAGAKKAVRK